MDDRDAHAWVEAWLPGRASSPSTRRRGARCRRRRPHRPASRGPVVDRRSGEDARGSHDRRAAASGGHERASVGRRASRSPAATAPAGRRTRDRARVDPRGRARDGSPAADRPRARGPRAEVGTARARLASRARRRGLSLPAGVTNGELAAALAADLDIDARAWASAADRAAYAPADEAERALPALRTETRRLRKAIRASRRVTLPV